MRLVHQNAVGKDVNLEETIGEYECSKVPEALFESNGSMHHGCKAWWLTAVLKDTHLKMEEKLFDIGWKMGSTHLEPVSLTVPPLPELTQWYTSVASKCPYNCSGAKFQVPRCAACKCKGNDTKCGRVIPVRTLVENNGCDKSDTDDSEQCLRCDWVTPWCFLFSNNACYHNCILS